MCASTKINLISHHDFGKRLFYMLMNTFILDSWYCSAYFRNPVKEGKVEV